MLRILETQIPYPPALDARGITEHAFFGNLDFYLGDYRTQHPEDFQDYLLAFDAPVLAQALFEQYVGPLREVNALFTEFPTLTRLVTTLSPEDMTADPVFSFNADLPEVSRLHTAVLQHPLRWDHAGHRAGVAGERRALVLTSHRPRLDPRRAAHRDPGRGGPAGGGD